MNRDNETLREAGEALYGPHWQAALASDLNITDRTVRRWAAGEFAIPDGIWPELATLCRKRGRALEKMADKLTA